MSKLAPYPFNIALFFVTTLKGKLKAPCEQNWLQRLDDFSQPFKVQEDRITLATESQAHSRRYYIHGIKQNSLQ